MFSYKIYYFFLAVLYIITEGEDQAKIIMNI